MVKRAQAVSQWCATDNRYLFQSPNAEFWRISSQTTNKVVGKKVDRHRMVFAKDVSGKDEPADPEVTDMLNRIPEKVWAKGPYDVGHTPQHNIVVDILTNQSGSSNTG